MTGEGIDGGVVKTLIAALKQAEGIELKEDTSTKLTCTMSKCLSFWKPSADAPVRQKCSQVLDETLRFHFNGPRKEGNKVWHDVLHLMSVSNQMLEYEGSDFAAEENVKKGALQKFRHALSATQKALKDLQLAGSADEVVKTFMHLANLKWDELKHDDGILLKSDIEKLEASVVELTAGLQKVALGQVEGHDMKWDTMTDGKKAEHMETLFLHAQKTICHVSVKSLDEQVKALQEAKAQLQQTMDTAGMCGENMLSKAANDMIIRAGVTKAEKELVELFSKYYDLDDVRAGIQAAVRPLRKAMANDKALEKKLMNPIIYEWSFAQLRRRK